MQHSFCQLTHYQPFPYDLTTPNVLHTTGRKNASLFGCTWTYRSVSGFFFFFFSFQIISFLSCFANCRNVRRMYGTRLGWVITLSVRGLAIKMRRHFINEWQLSRVHTAAATAPTMNVRPDRFLIIFLVAEIALRCSVGATLLFRSGISLFRQMPNSNFRLTVIYTNFARRSVDGGRVAEDVI